MTSVVACHTLYVGVELFAGAKKRGRVITTLPPESPAPLVLGRFGHRARFGLDQRPSGIDDVISGDASVQRLDDPVGLAERLEDADRIVGGKATIDHRDDALGLAKPELAELFDDDLAVIPNGLGLDLNHRVLHTLVGAEGSERMCHEQISKREEGE